MKDKLIKNLKKIGLDALGIAVCGGIAYFLPQLIPAVSGLEVFIGVALGLWAYEPLRGLIGRAVKK